MGNSVAGYANFQFLAQLRFHNSFNTILYLRKGAGVRSGGWSKGLNYISVTVAAWPGALISTVEGRGALRFGASVSQ